METFNLADRDFPEVSISRVAKDLGEEVDSLFLVEELILSPLSIADCTTLPVLVYPFEEQGLIYAKIRLLYKHLPKTINILCP